VNLLQTIASIDPVHGGMARYVSTLTISLRDQGHHVDIATFDGAASGNDPVHAWPGRGPRRRAPGFTDWLRTRATGYDAVLVHGLWQYHGIAVRRALAGTRTPYLVFPHGMLDPAHRRLNPVKHWKKAVYWKLVEHRVLRDAATVVFTCDEELRRADHLFTPWSIRPAVVPLGLEPPPPPTAPGADEPYLLFLGRIHPKKGPDLLLEAYAQLLTTGHPLTRLVIAGPGEDPALLRTLRDRARTLPGQPVRFVPMVQGPDKWNLIHGCEAFVLTSHQENFGLAVVEALACGKPVLISDQVHIHEAIVADGAGLAAPDTLDGARHLLATWARLTPDQRHTMGLRAADCYQSRYTINRSARHLLDLLHTLRPAS
jgi:glycosyltransferase involved in cell wall biosynthesis